MTQRSVSRRSGTSKLLVFLIVGGFLICFASPLFAGNTKVYEGINMQIPFVTGVYRMDIGPFNVNPYSNIRVTATGGSGSGTIDLTIYIVDRDGDVLGRLDKVTLDYSSSDTKAVSKVYAVPGQYVRFHFEGLDPVYVSLVVFGR